MRDLVGNGIAENLTQQFNLTGLAERPEPVSYEEYKLVIDAISKAKGLDYKTLGLESCSIEDELNKVHELGLFNAALLHSRK